MVDEIRKRWLIEREKEKILKENKRRFAALKMMQAIGIMTLWAALYKYARNMIFSMRLPDYLALGIGAASSILIFAAATATKVFLERKLLAGLAVLESKENEDAYVCNEMLVLKGRTDKEDLCMRIDIKGISQLESENGTTSFMYQDPSGGLSHFTCLDYYRPQIATLLQRNGVR